MTDTLFDTEGNQTTVNPSQTGKYDSWDVAALIRKAEAADAHISTLENENKAYRANQDTNATLESMLEKLDLLNQPPQTSTPNNQQVEPSQAQSQLTKEDILNLINENKKKDQAQANVNLIHKELEKAWGDNYKTKLTNKAKEMGVSQDFLGSMAENYPQAFLKVVLEQPNAGNPNIHVPPGQGIHTAPTSREMKYKDFRAQEKANPALIHDPNFQARKHEAAERLGQSFFE